MSNLITTLPLSFGVDNKYTQYSWWSVDICIVGIVGGL